MVIKRKGFIKRKRGVKKRSKIPSISKLMKACDTEFSLFVRGLKVDPEGSTTCYTCNTLKRRRRLQCGHFHSRKYKFIRWHPDNARPQCAGCNKWGNGEHAKFRRKLITEIGPARLDYLDFKFDTEVKLTRSFLEAKLEEIKALV